MSASFQWDAFKAFQIDPERERYCFGYAPSQGRRCHNPIKQSNVESAVRKLSNLGTMDPTSQPAYKLLDEIASAVLCVRNHQNQQKDVVKKWKRTMLCLNTESSQVMAPRADRVSVTQAPIASGRERLGRRTDYYSSAARRPRTAFVSMSQYRTEDAATSKYIRHAVASIEVPSTQEAPEDHHEPLTVITTSTLFTTTTTHEPQVARPDTTMRSPTSATTDSSSAILSASDPDPLDRSDATERSQPSQPLQTERAQSSSAEMTLRCGDTHAARRPISSTCDICFAPMPSIDALVYCKAQCGQNFHTECVQGWHARQTEINAAKTCPFCRARWAPPCEHDQQPPSDSVSELLTEQEAGALETPLQSTADDDVPDPPSTVDTHSEEGQSITDDVSYPPMPVETADVSTQEGENVADDVSYPSLPTDTSDDAVNQTLESDTASTVTSTTYPTSPAQTSTLDQNSRTPVRTKFSSLWKDGSALWKEGSPLAAGIAGVIPGMGAGVVLTLGALRLLRKL